MIRKVLGFGIGRTIFAVVFCAGELTLAPKYFRNLVQILLHWEEIAQGGCPVPGAMTRENILFLAWAFALLAVMAAISNFGSRKHRP